MDFRKATDALFARIDHADLARALGVSVALIRQARLGTNALARRSPPEGWEKAVTQLAQDRIKHYSGLVERLKNSP